ncbi:MAG: transporter substrate-binding domain-containing protein [Lentisphaeria bacterium]|nr:transporter substrate-binding domain-containing protein [Lentisphaeria bacterium]
MNAPLFSSAKVFKTGLVLLLTGLLCSCSFFSGGDGSADKSPAEPGSVTKSRIRARESSGVMLCLIAESGLPFSVYDEEAGWIGAEPEIVLAIAEKLKMNVRFIPVPTVALASALRNGRGDIAIGKRTAGSIAADHLAPVFPYAAAKNGKFALMVRADDTVWRQALEKAAAGLDGESMLKKHARDLKPVSVEVVEDSAGKEETLSISVDLKSGNPPKPEKK